MKRIRWGMVGGGHGGFIGEVHRMAARLDDRYSLIAGALSSDPERARASARDLGIAQGSYVYGLSRDGRGRIDRGPTASRR